MAQCSLATGGGDPKVPAYGGGRLPLSTFLAERVRGILQDPSRHPKLPAEVREWLRYPALALEPAARPTGCWSRASRAAASSSSSPTASRAATRTRRWACC